MVQSNYHSQESGVHPYSQKTKPDTLSQQFKIKDCPWKAATILLEDGMIGAVTWDMAEGGSVWTPEGPDP